MDWSGVDYLWIIVMFLSDVLDSDGTHSLQRIHWWTTDVMLHFSKSESVNLCVLNVEFLCIKIDDVKANSCKTTIIG